MGLIDPLLDWVLIFSPIVSIIIIGLMMSVLTTVIYKFASDQKKIKKLKDDMKVMQKKMKEIPKDQPEKMMELNSKIMKMQGPLMKESFKSMIYTIIPSLLVLAWMSANLAFFPLYPGQDFTITAEFNEGVIGDVSLDMTPGSVEYVNGATQSIVDGKAVWVVNAKEANSYSAAIDFHDELYSQEILIVDVPGRKYSNPEQIVEKGGLKTITVGNKKAAPLQGIPILSGINWLWTYILVTVICSSLLRKALKVY
jgi:uncharacterized membrane protein (DUF106 family)